MIDKTIEKYLVEDWKGDMGNQRIVALKKYPELTKLADKIAMDVAKRINQEAAKVKSEMPYRQQYVLEEVIRLLRDMV